MKLLYKPFAIVAKRIAARLGRSAFRALWGVVDQAEPPAPAVLEASMGRVLAAQMLEAATMAASAAVVDRASMRTFHHLFGVWPGETRTALVE